MINFAPSQRTKSRTIFGHLFAGEITLSWCAALFVLVLSGVPHSSLSQVPGSAECALICEGNASEEQLGICECYSVSVSSPPSSHNLDLLGWPTPGRVIPQMIRTHEREMEKVDDYLTIERISITPMPDIRFFERGKNGDFIQVPTVEVQRRQMEKDLATAGSSPNPDSGADPKKTFSSESPEMHAKVAEDPTIALVEMAKALQSLGDELLGPGALDGLAAGAQKAAEGSSAAYEQGKEGIEGVDDSDGLFGDDTLKRFQTEGYLDDTTIGVFHINSLTFERVENKFEGVNLRRRRGDTNEVTYFNNRSIDLSLSLPDTTNLIHTHWLAHNALVSLFPDEYRDSNYKENYKQQFIDMGVRVCNIYAMEKPVDGNDQNSRKKYDELWACFEADYKLRPTRLLVDATDYSSLANMLAPSPVYIERISADYRKVGPAYLPHQLREAVGRLLNGVFSPGRDSSIERRRKYMINQGLPASREWADLLADSMADPFFTDAAPPEGE